MKNKIVQKNKYLSDRIKEGEHQQQDFKFEINDSKKISRSLSAFANTDGGRLLIGVKDNGKIKGISSEEEYHMIEAASEMHTKPIVPFSTRKHIYQGKTILEIIIKKGNKRPYKAPDNNGEMKCFIRIKDQNIIADPIQENVWRIESNQKSVKIKYSNAERFLMSYLEKKKEITFQQFTAYSGISKAKATAILTNMTCLKIISIIHSESETLFRINET